MSGCRRLLPESVLCFLCWSLRRSHKQRRESARQRSRRKARSVSQFETRKSRRWMLRAASIFCFLRLALIPSGHHFSGVVNDTSYFYDPSWPEARYVFVKVRCLCVCPGPLCAGTENVLSVRQNNE